MHRTTAYYRIRLFDLLSSSPSRRFFKKAIAWVVLVSYLHTGILSSCYANYSYHEVVDGKQITYKTGPVVKHEDVAHVFRQVGHESDWVFRVSESKQDQALKFSAYERLGDGKFVKRFKDKAVETTPGSKNRTAFDKTFKTQTGKNSLHLIVSWDGSLKVKSAQDQSQKLGFASFNNIVFEDSIRAQELTTFAPQVINKSFDSQIGRWDIWQYTPQASQTLSTPSFYNDSSSKLILKELHLHQGTAHNKGSLKFKTGGSAHLYGNSFLNERKVKGDGDLNIAQAGTFKNQSSSSSKEATVKARKGHLKIEGVRYEDSATSVLEAADVSLTLQQPLALLGKIQQASVVNIATPDITLHQQLLARQVSLKARQALTLLNLVKGDDGIELSAGTSLEYQDWGLETSGVLKIITEQPLLPLSRPLRLKGRLEVKAPKVAVSSGIQAKNGISITAQQKEIDVTGELLSEKDITLNGNVRHTQGQISTVAGRLFFNGDTHTLTSKLAAAKGITVKSRDGFEYTLEALQTPGLLRLIYANPVSLNQQITTSGRLVLEGLTFEILQSIAASQGITLKATRHTPSGPSLTVHSLGKLLSPEGRINLEAPTMLNQGEIKAHLPITIKTTHQSREYSLVNLHEIISDEDVDIVSPSVENRGSSQASEPRGVIKAGRKISIETTDKRLPYSVVNTGDLIVNREEGQTSEGRDILVKGQGFDHGRGSLSTPGNFKFDGSNFQLMGSTSIEGDLIADVKESFAYSSEALKANGLTRVNLSNVPGFTLTTPIKTPGGFELDIAPSLQPARLPVRILADIATGKNITFKLPGRSFVLGQEKSTQGTTHLPDLFVRLNSGGRFTSFSKDFDLVQGGIYSTQLFHIKSDNSLHLGRLLMTSGKNAVSPVRSGTGIQFSISYDQHKGNSSYFASNGGMVLESQEYLNRGGEVTVAQGNLEMVATNHWTTQSGITEVLNGNASIATKNFMQGLLTTQQKGLLVNSRFLVDYLLTTSNPSRMKVNGDLHFLHVESGKNISSTISATGLITGNELISNERIHACLSSIDKYLDGLRAPSNLMAVGFFQSLPDTYNKAMQSSLQYHINSAGPLALLSSQQAIIFDTQKAYNSGTLVSPIIAIRFADSLIMQTHGNYFGMQRYNSFQQMVDLSLYQQPSNLYAIEPTKNTPCVLYRTVPFQYACPEGRRLVMGNRAQNNLRPFYDDMVEIRLIDMAIETMLGRGYLAEEIPDSAALHVLLRHNAAKYAKKLAPHQISWSQDKTQAYIASTDISQHTVPMLIYTLRMYQQEQTLYPILFLPQHYNDPLALERVAKILAGKMILQGGDTSVVYNSGRIHSTKGSSLHFGHLKNVKTVEYKPGTYIARPGKKNIFGKQKNPRITYIPGTYVTYPGGDITSDGTIEIEAKTYEGDFGRLEAKNLGAKLDTAHTTGVTKATDVMSWNVKDTTVERAQRKWQESFDHTVTKRKALGRKKTTTTTHTGKCSESFPLDISGTFSAGRLVGEKFEEVAELFPNLSSTEEQVETFTLQGALLEAGAGGISMHLKKLLEARPNVDTHLTPYATKAKSRWGGSRKETGSVQTHTITKPAIISEGSLKTTSDDKIRLQATDVLVWGKGNGEGGKPVVELIALNGAEFPGMKVKQELPPQLEKFGSFGFKRTTGTVEEGATSSIINPHGIIRVDGQQGHVTSEGLQLMSRGNTVTGASVHSSPLVLEQRMQQTAKGTKKLGYIQQKTRTLDESAIAPRYIALDGGTTVTIATQGDNIQVAPVITGDSEHRAENGSTKVIPLQLRHETTVQTKSAGLTGGALAATNSLLRGDLGETTQHLLRTVPIAGALQDFLKSKDSDHKAAASVKAAVQAFTMANDFAQVANVSDFLAGQVGRILDTLATVKIRFGTSQFRQESTTSLNPQVLGHSLLKVVARVVAEVKGLEGDIRELHVEGDEARILPAEETCTTTSKDKGVSVGVNLARMTPVIGADSSSSRTKSTHVVANSLPGLDQLTLIGGQTATVGVDIETATANVTTPHLIYQNFQDHQETKHKSASVELGPSSVTGSIAFGKTKKSTTTKQANIRAQQGTFTVGQTTRIAPRDTESGTGFGLTLSASLSSPQDFARDIGKTVVTAATSIAAAELAHQAGLGNAAASLVGMAAGAYASSQYNQLMQGESTASSLSDPTSSESRSFIDQVLQFVRSPLPDSGLGLIGEVSYAHGHHRATMALVDVDTQRVSESLQEIRHTFSGTAQTGIFSGQSGELHQAYLRMRQLGASPEDADEVLSQPEMVSLFEWAKRTNKALSSADQRSTLETIPEEEEVQIPGQETRVTIRPGKVSKLKGAVVLLELGAETLASFSESHPHLTEFTLSAVQLATGGAGRFVLAQVAEYTLGDTIEAGKTRLAGFVADKLGYHDALDVESAINAISMAVDLSLGKAKAAIKEAKNVAKVIEKRTKKWASAAGQTPKPVKTPGMKPKVKQPANSNRPSQQQPSHDRLEGLDLAKPHKPNTKHSKDHTWEVKPGKEYRAKIIGKAQKTGTPGHAERTYREAIRAAKRDDVEKVYLNRGYNKATGEKIKSNRRPDVIVVSKNKKVDAIEVPSRTDKEDILLHRNEEAMNKLSKSKRGRVRIENITKEGTQ